MTADELREAMRTLRSGEPLLVNVDEQHPSIQALLEQPYRGVRGVAADRRGPSFIVAKLVCAQHDAALVRAYGANDSDVVRIPYDAITSRPQPINNAPL